MEQNKMRIKWTEIHEHIPELYIGNNLLWDGWKTVEEILKCKRTKNEFLRDNPMKLICKWENTNGIEEWIVHNNPQLHYYKNETTLHEYLHNEYVEDEPDFISDSGKLYELKEFWDWNKFITDYQKQNYHRAEYAFIYIINEEKLYLMNMDENKQYPLIETAIVFPDRIHVERICMFEVKSGKFSDYEGVIYE